LVFRAGESNTLSYVNSFGLRPVLEDVMTIVTITATSTAATMTAAMTGTSPRTGRPADWTRRAGRPADWTRR
jgi:hypothetical protein